MKKSERIELAQKCFDRIQMLNLNIEIKENWLVLSPPSKIPADLSIDIVNCSEYLIELFRKNNSV